uniref:YhcH/YjgK/YiaL family protein n=1 Tax=Enterocloster clostridioformis TaxID=1531 RepID=UPI0026EA58F6|nr:YhcH/YjgK/YiaL family protein [Enterocloster clostridioformis]
MIYDLLANIGNYRGMNRNLDKAIDYLMTADVRTLPIGRTEIDGDRVFLQVMEARTHELTDESYELHRDYMDIQIDIEGCEVIETALDGVTPIGEYQPDFQKACARGGAGGRCVMGPGRFILCMPGRPMGRADAWKRLNVSENVW